MQTPQGTLDRDRLYVAGLWLLAPAPALFAIRSVLAYAERTSDGLGPLLGIGGALSLVGLVLAGSGTYRTPRFPLVATGVGLALLGHFVLGQIPSNVGDAMVYVGTGLVAFPLRRGAVVPAVLAAVGVLLRDQVHAGHLFVAAGAAALAVLLVFAGRDALGRARLAARKGT